MTNREWLNSLSNEEFAKLLPSTFIVGFGNDCFANQQREANKCDRMGGDCVKCKVEFLQSEYDKNAKKAYFFERFDGRDFYRDKYGNIYTKCGNTVAYCSNLKRGCMTEDKAEPYYPVFDVELVEAKQ